MGNILCKARSNAVITSSNSIIYYEFVTRLFLTINYIFYGAAIFLQIIEIISFCTASVNQDVLFL